MPDVYDRVTARRLGRRLSAFVHGLAGAAITVVVLRVFAGVSLWWLVPIVAMTVIAMFGSGLVAGRLLDEGEVDRR